MSEISIFWPGKAAAEECADEVNETVSNIECDGDNDIGRGGIGAANRCDRSLKLLALLLLLKF